MKMDFFDFINLNRVTFPMYVSDLENWNNISNSGCAENGEATKVLFEPTVTVDNSQELNKYF